MRTELDDRIEELHAEEKKISRAATWALVLGLSTLAYAVIFAQIIH